MRDEIWVSITELEPVGTVTGTRVLSVSPANREVVEHLSVDGTARVLSAGRTIDGAILAYLYDPSPDNERSLVEITDGQTTVMAEQVSGFRLSGDGRFLAVAYSDPPAGAAVRFETTDLVDGRTASFEAPGINAGPAAWSPDGRYLIVDEQWEQNAAWVIDPWSDTWSPIEGTERILDGACFIDVETVAHRTWNVGYGQGDAELGNIRLTSLDTGAVIDTIGDGMFGDGFRCHTGGSISYLSRPEIFSVR